MFEKEILEKAKEISQELISIRRDIHAHPELGMREVRTSGLAASRLKQLGLEVKTGIGKTGVVGLLKGNNEGRTIMLRADMDCLKLDEKNDIAFKSQVEGLMHACGHDVHTSWLIGAAIILTGLKDKLNGNVKFVFQPAEELSEGASLLIEEGVLENPRVDAVVGGHVWPYMDSGILGIKEGSIMAASDKFKLTIFGKGGHGGHPHKCIDPIASACEIFMAIQTIISRRVNPVEPTVITVGKFNSGTAHNVIPDKVEMEGTIRSLTHETRDMVKELMEKITKGITDANGASYEFEYVPCHPPVINNHEITDLIEKSGVDILGRNFVHRVERATMAGEDFSFYQERVPGAFFWLGIGDDKLCTHVPLHAPNFMVDEEVIHKGAAVLAQCAVNFLNK